MSHHHKRERRHVEAARDQIIEELREDTLLEQLLQRRQDLEAKRMKDLPDPNEKPRPKKRGWCLSCVFCGLRCFSCLGKGSLDCITCGPCRRCCCDTFCSCWTFVIFLLLFSLASFIWTGGERLGPKGGSRLPLWDTIQGTVQRTMERWRKQRQERSTTTTTTLATYTPLRPSPLDPIPGGGGGSTTIGATPPKGKEEEDTHEGL